MTRILEMNFIPQVADAVAGLGYKVTREPSRIPKRRSWQDDPLSLVRGPRYRPDIAVEHNGEFVIIEVKTRPVLLAGVIQARQYADYFDAAVVICLPDDVFPEIPKSVRKFADEQSVRLSPLVKVGEALADLLN